MSGPPTPADDRPRFPQGPEFALPEQGAEPPTVSVCIVTWNCRGLVLDCLRSLEKAAEGVGCEIIVVDNASQDGTVEAIGDQFRDVKILANTENKGFAAANNQALREARGDFLFLLNPDTVLPPGALSELVRLAEEYPQAGAIGPKLLNPDGTLQYSCRRFPRPWAALFRHTLLGKLFPSDRWTREYLMLDWAHDEVREVDWVSGAAMFLRREAVAQVGPLDEGYFWGSEDVDYCKRLHEAGWTVLYTPTPAILHRVGGSTDRAVLATIWRRHASWYRLYAKHFSRGWLDRLALGALIWLRAALLAASWVARLVWTKLKRPIVRRFRRRK